MTSPVTNLKMAKSLKRNSLGHQSPKNCRQAFSLVELIVVISIAALIAAAITMNWAGSLSAAVLTNSIETIVEYDRQTRRHATTYRLPCKFEIDDTENTIAVSRWNNGREFTKRITFSKRVQITTLEPAGNPFTIDRFGSSQTILIELSSQSNQRRWLLIAGGTGQHHIFNNEQDAQSLFNFIESTGANSG